MSSIRSCNSRSTTCTAALPFLILLFILVSSPVASVITAVSSPADEMITAPGPAKNHYHRSLTSPLPANSSIGTNGVTLGSSYCSNSTVALPGGTFSATTATDIDKIQINVVGKLSVDWNHYTSAVSKPLSSFKSSFVKSGVDAGSYVATADGPRTIQNVRVGERVWSYDHVHQRQRLSRVTHTYGPMHLDLNKAHLRSVFTSRSHRFYSQTTQAYIPAHRIESACERGLELLAFCFDEISEQCIRNVTVSCELPGTTNMTVLVEYYNIKVETDHNYFVNVWSNSDDKFVLTHNPGSDDDEKVDEGEKVDENQMSREEWASQVVGRRSPY